MTEQYHIKFETDFRDTSALSGEDIADLVDVVKMLKEFNANILKPQNKLESLAVLEKYKADLKSSHARMYAIEMASELLLDALSDHDPQLYVDLNDKVSSMTVSIGTGKQTTYKKTKV